jgi:hypothetical protein
MAASIFELVAEELERRSDLAKLEARGTVRLALKEAGLDPRTVTAEQTIVMLQKVMPDEMRSRGVEQPEQICEAIITALKSNRAASSAPEAESPEAIFHRLAEG